jgi:hypothetical protein
MHEKLNRLRREIGLVSDRGLCLTRRVWSGISLPNSFPLSGSSTPFPSGNGGEENCIPVRATAHVESSPQSNSWSAKTL